MKTKIILSFILILFSKSYAKKLEDVKEYNTIIFYFVDNSDGSNANSLSAELIAQLKENLNKKTTKPDDYFFFYGCNAESQLISSRVGDFADSPALKKYLSNPSRESEYVYDKKVIREHFAEYPIKVKQKVEINIYLSAYAVKRIPKEIETLPTPLFIANELPVYLNIVNRKDIVFQTNIYINKEVKEELGEAKINEKINSYFNFCKESLNLDKNQPQIIYL
jgi:hypothetical protein